MTELQNLPVEQLQPNPWNRTVFDPRALEELAASIKAEGIREPLKVRTLKSGQYQLVSGHRRWLAAQKVGLKDVPCFIESLTDEQVAEDNITINIQREGLPPLELARMLSEYMEHYDKNQAETAGVFGKTQPWVSELVGFIGIHPSLKNIGMPIFSWPQLRSLKQLPPTLQQQIAKELEKGDLKPENIQKRCQQLLFTAKIHREPPPDPLEQVWVNLKKSADIAPDKWDIHYSVGKYVVTVNTGSEDSIDVLYDVLQSLADHIPASNKREKNPVKEPTTWEEYEAQIKQNVPPEQVEQMLKVAKMSRQMQEPGANPDKAYQAFLDELDQEADAQPKKKPETAMSSKERIAAIIARRKGM